MTTTDEAYFLVRVGTWSQDDLEAWVQKRIDAQMFDEDDWKEEDDDDYF